MKKEFYWLWLLSLVSNFYIYGQTQQFCETPAITDNSFLNSSYSITSVQNDEHYCLRVYFHVIRRSDGTGGQSVSSVNQALQVLNNDYNPHNISFVWDNTIDYIDDTSYYNNPSANIFNVNNNSDGIDIYLYDSSVGGSGLANGVGNSSEFYVTGSWNSPYQTLATSHVISHEMGHVLFLWHTHHGTVYEGGSDTGQCPELVNGSNATTCGDYVADTPADPYISFNVNSSCQWLGSGVDANGHSYNPDTKNIMAYSTPQCMSYFTPLQGLRMRNAIQTLSHLQQALVNCCEGTELDLYIKDCPTDFGQEPSGCVDFWDSPDIWVRNNQDGQTENQNPVYRPSGTPNYIYVKVRNLSCVPSSGNEKLKIYWAKANTSYAWPDYWNGTAENDQGIPLSSGLPSVDIPVIQPGQEVVVAVPWVVPNPADYSDMEEPWHYCIMARVESEDDPMTFPETADSGENIRNNNNIAQKNVTIVNPSPGNPIGATVGVGNAFPVSRDFVFEFQDKTETGKFLYREAEITIRLDDRLLQTWKNSGGVLNNMKQVSDSTFLITDNNASFGSLKFEPHQIDLLTLNFNFLTSEITDKDQFIYNVVQKDLQGNVVGGETYEIRKNSGRTLFFAGVAGETEVNKNEPVLLIAESINEPAIYNWYNDEGELVYEGIDFTTSVEVGKEYKLEVIALSDGYKDYSDVALTLKPNAIETIYPNPATADVITVDYTINEGTSAYLSITGTYMSNVSDNYILDTNQDQITIDVSNYPLGTYVITLVTDGNISDSENLIIH